MTKKNLPQKAKTHFDLIPVAIVKKIADPDVPAKKAGTYSGAFQPAAIKTEPYSVPAHLLHRSEQ